MEKADPGPLVPSVSEAHIWILNHLTVLIITQENPGFMSTQAEGNWEREETPKELRSREARNSQTLQDGAIYQGS